MQRGRSQENVPVRFVSPETVRAPALRFQKPGLVPLLLSAAAWILSLLVLSSASASQPKTRAVTTGALQMTGQGAGAEQVRMTSGVLQMTGLGAGAAEVTLTSGALQMTGLGAGAAEVTLTSGALQMTGLDAGGTAVRITTGELRMTGFGL